MIDKIAEHAAEETQKKLYAHYDYFGYIIPASWFIIGILIVETYFFRGTSLRRLMDASFIYEGYFRRANTSLEVVLAVLFLVVVFNTVYVVGHLINSLSALLYDRVAVKKLLGYPFTLYEDARTNRLRTQHENLRDRVRRASYLVTCLNIVPWLAFEITVVAYDHRPFLSAAFQRHQFACTVAVGVLAVVHLGWPRTAWHGERPQNATYYALLHLLILIFAVALITNSALQMRSALPVLLLPIANIVWAVSERAKLQRMRQGEALPNYFLYARISFLNVIYWAANLTDYGETPSVEVIQEARRGLGDLATRRDFFWMSWISVQNRAPGSYSTAYHFLSMNSMSRNLSNATGLVAIYSASMFWFRRPDGDRALVMTWLVALAVLTFIFFVRYLYLYSCYYSRYVLRTAALISHWQRDIEREGGDSENGPSVHRSDETQTTLL